MTPRKKIKAQRRHRRVAKRINVQRAILRYNDSPKRDRKGKSDETNK